MRLRRFRIVSVVPPPVSGLFVRWFVFFAKLTIFLEFCGNIANLAPPSFLVYMAPRARWEATSDFRIVRRRTLVARVSSPDLYIAIRYYRFSPNIRALHLRFVLIEKQPRVLSKPNRLREKSAMTHTATLYGPDIQ